MGFTGNSPLGPRSTCSDGGNRRERNRLGSSSHHRCSGCGCCSERRWRGCACRQRSFDDYDADYDYDAEHDHGSEYDAGHNDAGHNSWWDKASLPERGWRFGFVELERSFLHPLEQHLVIERGAGLYARSPGRLYFSSRERKMIRPIPPRGTRQSSQAVAGLRRLQRTPQPSEVCLDRRNKPVDAG